MGIMDSTLFTALRGTYSTLLPCLPPHMKEDEKQHHDAAEEGFFGGMSCIELGGHVRGSTLLQGRNTYANTS